MKVLFFGVLRDLTGCAEDTADMPPGATVADLFERYALRHETLRAARPSIVFARNREFTRPETPLAEQDEVAFLPPVSGGSAPPPEPAAAANHEPFLHVEDASGHMFALTRAPIDAQRWARRLQRPEDGAVIVFEGIVRNNTKGRATRYLEYECYEAMAVEQMARIGGEIAARFPVGRMGMIHRLGRLEIGEASVAVIATAPHRKAAFDAAFEGINRLKREVPIWKKEFFEDGAVWVEGEWDDKLLGRPTP